MVLLIIYTGIAAFGLLCLIRPQFLLKRKNPDKEIPAKDIRFFRMFGAVLVGLYLLGFAIQLVQNLL